MVFHVIFILLQYIIQNKIRNETYIYFFCYSIEHDILSMQIKYGISDKKRPKMGLFCSYMTKRDLKHLISLYLQGE